VSIVDLVILGFVLLSTVMGFKNGIIRSIFSVCAWLAAVFVTLRFSNRFVTVLPIDSVESPLARATISALILFFGTLIIAVTMRWFVERIFPRDAIRLRNRFAGSVFGFLRGMLLVSLVVLGANLVPELKQESWWDGSRLLPRFQKVAKSLHKRLPESIGQHFDF
jgi:membrane protein required for colicin V production